VLGRAQVDQFPVDRATPPPVLELDRPQSVAQPFVQRAPDSRCLCQPKVGFPSQQIGFEPVDDLLHAASARASGQLPDPLLERRHRLVGHPAFHPICGKLEAVAQKLSPRHARYRTLGLIDLEPQLAVTLAQQRHDPFAGFPTAHIYVAVISLKRGCRD
jgi:hypothetical protein